MTSVMHNKDLGDEGEIEPAGIQRKVKMAGAYSEDSNLDCASASSEWSLSLQPEVPFDPWLPIKRPSKTLIRLRNSAV